MDKQKQLLKESDLARAARAAREKAGLTQHQAAQQLGVKQPTIAQAEGVPERRLNKLRIEMIEAFSPFEVKGPYWCLTPVDRKA